MTPTRIQRKRTKGWRKPPGTICVDRSSKRFGNPYRVYRDPALAVRKFRVYAGYMLERDPHWLDPLREAKFLACWCKLDEPCHGDVLIELLRETEAP